MVARFVGDVARLVGVVLGRVAGVVPVLGRWAGVVPVLGRCAGVVPVLGRCAGVVPVLGRCDGLVAWLLPTLEFCQPSRVRCCQPASVLRCTLPFRSANTLFALLLRFAGRVLGRLALTGFTPR